MRGLAFLLALMASGAAAAAPWERVRATDGITVWKREVRGRNLPQFVGVGTVEASLWEVVAVFMDEKRACEWRHRCVAHKVLSKKAHWDALVYTRTRGQWPVADRDVVVHATGEERKPDHELMVRFRSVTSPLKREVDDAVRMPSLTGYFNLRRVNDRVTRVEFMGDGDPGGWVPDWLARRVSQDIPYHTIANLRRQIRKTRGWYERWLDENDPRRRAVRRASGG